MHQAQWSPERPLPPPVSLASQSHNEKPPEVTCTSRGNPGFPASTRERPRETFFNTSGGQIPLPWLGSNEDRKSTRLNSSHQLNSYAVFCLKKKKKERGYYESRALKEEGFIHFSEERQIRDV